MAKEAVDGEMFLERFSQNGGLYRARVVGGGDGGVLHRLREQGEGGGGEGHLSLFHVILGIR